MFVDTKLSSLLFQTLFVIGSLNAARAVAFADATSTVALPTPSPVVPLGGQCGGLTYKGPTGCEQIKGLHIECVFVNPYLHQCQIVKPTATITDPPSLVARETCLTSTLACSASCRILCPPGQHLTGSSCPFCVCETPTPLCSPTPTQG